MVKLATLFLYADLQAKFKTNLKNSFITLDKTWKPSVEIIHS